MELEQLQEEEEKRVKNHVESLLLEEMRTSLVRDAFDHPVKGQTHMPKTRPRDAKPLLPAWAWYAISSTVSTAVGLAIFFTILRRRRNSKRKASREPLMPAAAREDEE